MRIAFVGKGGSGKTTWSALFALAIAKKGFSTLAIDADINQHLADAFGVTATQKKGLTAIGHELSAVRKFFAGENPRVKADGTFRMTTPPGRGSVLLSSIQHRFVERYSLVVAPNLRLMETGDFEEKDVGMICYHGKTMATEIFLNHLKDPRSEYVVVDMTAGADTFSTGTFLKFDLLVLVVEPTKKSLEVYQQFKEFLPAEYRLAVVGNKIESSEDEAFIRGVVKEEFLMAAPHLSRLKLVEQGKESLQNLVNDTVVQAVVGAIENRLSSLEPAWKKRHDDLVALHREHAKSWLNASFGIDFAMQIDPDFFME